MVGVEDTLIELNIFGLKTVETVLTGSHYYRSLNGLMIVAEEIKRLKCEAFWKTHSMSDFNGSLAILNKVSELLSDKKHRENSPYSF